MMGVQTGREGGIPSRVCEFDTNGAQAGHELNTDLTQTERKLDTDWTPTGHRLNAT